jgi:hypothetical protein
MDEESFRGMQEGLRELEADHPDLNGIYTITDAETCQRVFYKGHDFAEGWLTQLPRTMASTARSVQ